MITINSTFCTNLFAFRLPWWPAARRLDCRRMTRYLSQIFVEKIKISAKVWHSRQPNLIELAERLNLTEFVRLAKEAGVDRIINHEGKMQFVFKKLNF